MFACVLFPHQESMNTLLKIFLIKMNGVPFFFTQ